MMNTQTLLHVNSSGRFQGSVTRQVSDRLVSYLKQDNPELEIINQDLAGKLF